MSALETELQTFSNLLPTMLDSMGKYAVIKGTNLLGTFDSYEDALKIGFERCGLDPFLVKRIGPAEQVSFFTRDLRAACQA